MPEKEDAEPITPFGFELDLGEDETEDSDFLPRYYIGRVDDDEKRRVLVMSWVLDLIAEGKMPVSHSLKYMMGLEDFLRDGGKLFPQTLIPCFKRPTDL